MLNLDPNTEYGARVLRRLERDEVAWLTTVGASGTPRPAPIWFLWEKGSLLIYSQPNQAKLRNLERHPQVAFNFNGDEFGGNIIILTGTARVAPDAPPVIDNHAYLAKYDAAIGRLGMTPQSFSDTYATAILFTPDHLSGH